MNLLEAAQAFFPAIGTGQGPTAKTQTGSSTRIPGQGPKGPSNRETGKTGKEPGNTRGIAKTVNERAKEVVAAGGNFILTFSLL